MCRTKSYQHEICLLRTCYVHCAGRLSTVGHISEASIVSFTRLVKSLYGTLTFLFLFIEMLQRFMSPCIMIPLISIFLHATQPVTSASRSAIPQPVIQFPEPIHGFLCSSSEGKDPHLKKYYSGLSALVILRHYFTYQLQFFIKLGSYEDTLIHFSMTGPLRCYMCESHERTKRLFCCFIWNLT